MFRQFKRMLLGAPIATEHSEHQKLNVGLGLAVFAADALSSTAYATDEILIALAASSYAVFAGVLSIPVAIAIALLIALVVLSYRQVIRAYPEGGGAYVVAKENLGTTPSHVAAAALLIDYVLTVAVSISAGVAAFTSTGLLPHAHSTTVCVVLTIFIMLVNLRGVKESGMVFAIPAYAFLVSMLTLFAAGAWKFFHNPVVYPAAHVAHVSDAQTLTSLGFILVFLKAFSHGCAGLTGIEAVSNGVKAFKEPRAVLANRTMTLMGLLLGGIFLGITLLAFGFHIMPAANETILSQVARQVFGGNNPFYFFVQFSTMVLLILAANTAFADFPRVSNLLANDGFLPRQLMNIGDRLVFNNGIFILAFLSIVLIIAYKGDTHSLIPLYAVGVFISFTASQSGLIVRHLRNKETGWQRGIAINIVGAIVTAVVTIILAIEKFHEGAWIVLLAIPLIVLLFRKVKSHYQSVGRQLTLEDNYNYQMPHGHKVLVLVSSIGKGTIPALHYAKTVSPDVEAIHVELDSRSTERLKNQWCKWGCDVPLKVLPSPYRSITDPILQYLDELQTANDNQWVTIVVPEFVTKHFWHNLLHNQTAIMLKALLRFRKDTIVTTVRFHLEE